MINYTEHLSLLMEDVVRRTPALSCVRVEDLLVFGRFGRADAEGAFATCHCLTLPTSEPGYFYWRDRMTGELTRQSEWFITKSPRVTIGARRIKYLISFVVPRFCNQTLRHSRKALFYPVLVALRHNPIIAAFGQRLRAKGKHKMVVIAAAMRKLAHLAFGVIKTGQPFNPDHLVRR